MSAAKGCGGGCRVAVVTLARTAVHAAPAPAERPEAP